MFACRADVVLMLATRTQEAIVYAQLGQQPLARTTETSHWNTELGDSLLFERAAS
jgi:hypothetical protein